MSRRRFRKHTHRTTHPPVTKLNNVSLAAPSSTSAPTKSKQLPADRFLQQVIVMAFHFLVVTVPFFFTWVNEELFEFNKMLLTYGITIVIGGLWISRMVLARKILLRRTWFDLPILFFLASQIISTIFSIHTRTSIFGYYTRFHGGLLSTFTYIVLFYALVSNVRRSQVKNILLSLTIAALGVTAYAIPEHFGMSPSCILITGEANAICWKQDVQNRIFGTFGQPNWLAAYCITLIPLCISQSIEWLKKSKLKSVLFGVTSVTLFITLLYTKSRSGFFGMLLGLGVYFVGLGLLFITKPSSNSNTDRRVGLGVAGLLAGVMAVSAFLIGTPVATNLSFSNLIKQSQQLAEPPLATETPTETQQPVNRLDIGGTDSGEIRKIVWRGAYDVWRRYPLLGSGVETFAYSYYGDRPVEHNLVSEWDFLYNKAHNEFLNFLATTGLVGLAAYGVLLTAFIGVPLLVILADVGQWRLPHLDLENDEIKLTAIAVAAGLCALSVSNFFGFSTVMVTILLFILPGIFWLMADPLATEHVAKTNLKPWQYGGLVVTGILSLFLLSKVYSIWHADLLYTTGKHLAASGKVTEGILTLTEAIRLSPQEALYHDELAQAYAQVAAGLASQGDATQSARFVDASLVASKNVFALNPVHVNFYKTQARMYITLSNIDLKYLAEAKRVLEEGRELAPTDAKLVYNIALLQLSQGETEAGRLMLEHAIDLRPTYDQARMTLAELFEEQGQYQEAVVQYQAIVQNTPTNTVAPARIAALEASISAQSQTAP